MASLCVVKKTPATSKCCVWTGKNKLENVEKKEDVSSSPRLMIKQAPADAHKKDTALKLRTKSESPEKDSVKATAPKLRIKSELPEKVSGKATPESRAKSGLPKKDSAKDSYWEHSERWIQLEDRLYLATSLMQKAIAAEFNFLQDYKEFLRDVPIAHELCSDCVLPIKKLEFLRENRIRAAIIFEDLERAQQEAEDAHWDLELAQEKVYKAHEALVAAQQRADDLLLYPGDDDPFPFVPDKPKPAYSSSPVDEEEEW